MYGLSFYITPEDVLEKLSEEDRARFNQCVFYDVNKNLDGSIDVTCLLFNDHDKSNEPERVYGSLKRFKLFWGELWTTIIIA